MAKAKPSQAAAQKQQPTNAPAPELKQTIIADEPQHMFGFPGMEQVLADAMEKLGSVMYVQTLLEEATWKRKALAFLLVIAAGMGIGWIAGTLLGYAIVGAVMLGAPTFVSLLIYALGTLLTIYASMKAGQAIGIYVLSGKIDEHAAKVWSLIKSPFKRKEKQLVPA